MTKPRSFFSSVHLRWQPVKPVLRVHSSWRGRGGWLFGMRFLKRYPQPIFCYTLPYCIWTSCNIFYSIGILLCNKPHTPITCAPFPIQIPPSQNWFGLTCPCAAVGTPRSPLPGFMSGEGGGAPKRPVQKSSQIPRRLVKCAFLVE